MADHDSRNDSRADRLDTCRRGIDGAHGYWGMDELRDGVQRALHVPAPDGAPDAVYGLADLMAQLAVDCDIAYDELSRIASQDLPQAWLGVAAVEAAEAVSAALGALGFAARTFDDAATLLRRLGEDIADAQHRDRCGRPPLARAALILRTVDTALGYDGHQLARAQIALAQIALAQTDARDGVGSLTAAAQAAQEAGLRAARGLTALAAKAHAARLATGSLTDLDKIVLTDARVPGSGETDDAPILTAAAASRASAALDRMRVADRVGINALLAKAKSPQERVYLIQAVAAGHSLAEVERFQAMIHPHGTDPVWLREHCSPGATDLPPDAANARVEVTFDGRRWSQGRSATCVAGANVFARALVDPLYAVWLTTGGHPDDPADDAGAAFGRRFEDQQARVYDSGRSVVQRVCNIPGMTGGQALQATNVEVGPATGERFETVRTTEPDDRRDLLPRLEHTVDQGIPVTFAVTGARDHEMVIIGHDGALLEIYNPWGYVTWVDEDDFVDGHLDVNDPAVPPKVDLVNLPMARHG